MKIMKPLRRVLYHSLLLGLIVSYQNCTRVNFETLPNSDSVLKFGNGSAYGGKPSVDLYRFTPEFTCEQKEAPVSTIQIRDNQISVTENKKLQCGAAKFSLDSSQLDTSVYQNELVGYQEGIFESLLSAPESIPANLVEVWCLDQIKAQNEEPNIETITRFDREKNLAVSRIYYSQNGTFKQINDFTVSRVASQTSVIVKDSAGFFDLTVHRDQPSLSLGLFKADLKVLIDGQSLSRQIDCRLGGSVDPKVWPARQIVDLDMTNFLFSSDLEAMAWSSASISNGARVYTAMIDGSQQRPVSSPNLTALSSQSVWFTPDSKSVLYTGDVNTPKVFELFKVHLDGSSTVQINESLKADFQNVEVDLKINADSSKVFYRDGSQMDGFVDELWLRSNNLKGGTPQVLFPPSSPLTQAPPGNCIPKRVSRKFDYSSKYDRVALLGGGDFCEDIYLVNDGGANLKKVTPPLPASEWRFDWGTSITIPPGSDYAIALAWTTVIPLQYQYYAIHLDGLDSFPFGDMFSNKQPQILLASGNIVYISDSNSRTMIANLALRKNWNVPFLISPFFSKDNSQLYGISPDGVAVRISTANGHVEKICDGKDRKGILLKDYNEDSLLAGFYDSHGQVQIDLWSSTGACSNITSFPIENLKDASLLKVAPDRKRIIMRVGFPNEDRKSLYYIPLNRQSPLLVNMPLLRNGKILEAEFTNDSQSIVYSGTQLGPGETNAFLWKVPEDLK